MPNRRPGRPRDASVDAAVLKAAAELLSTEGYERTTIDDVARAAGVTRPTVYRRWPSKDELVIAAVANLIQPGRHEPTGDLRRDLLDVTRSLQERWLDNRYLGLLGTAIVEREHHPRIYACFHERLIIPRREELRQILRRGITDGSVREDTDVEVVVAMVVGAFYAVAVANQWDEAEDWAVRVVDTALRMVLAEPEPINSAPA